MMVHIINDQILINHIFFNDFLQSSTPRNLSPRNLSPIKTKQNADEQILNLNNNSSLLNMPKTTSDSAQTDEDSKKKNELVKQRLELAEEQKKLREMLESQEKIIQLKQEEILVQQKLHHERLEELNRIKVENEREIMFKHNQSLMNSFLPPQLTAQRLQQQLTMPQYHQLPFVNNHNQMTDYFYPPNQITSPQFVPNHSQQIAFNPTVYNHQQSLPKPVGQPYSPVQESINQIEMPNIDNLASLVYRKLLLRKKVKENSACSSPTVKLNKSNKKKLVDSDDYLIQVINATDSKSDKKEEKMKVKNSESKINHTNCDYDEIEESKLIEDLFFIK
jgi:hypothetical protein